MASVQYEKWKYQKPLFQFVDIVQKKTIMKMMCVFFFLFFIIPQETIHTVQKFNTVVCYDNRIFLAPFTGTSIFEFTKAREFKPITFTDDVNFRIYDFHITPFALYLNNGTAINKFYFASGIIEEVYSSKDISAFIITPFDELIFADRTTHELTFLDFADQVKFKKTDIIIKDLQEYNNVIYALSSNNMILFDEHGNVLEEKKIPENCNRLFVDSNNIYLYSNDKKYLYRLADDWEKIDLPHSISDICANNKLTVMLDGLDNNLYIYNKSDF